MEQFEIDSEVAEWQGTHFKFASRAGVTLIEVRRHERFYYWLLWDGQKKLIHASVNSKFRSMQTVGCSFTPSANYDPAISHDASQPPLRPRRFGSES